MHNQRCHSYSARGHSLSVLYRLVFYWRYGQRHAELHTGIYAGQHGMERGIYLHNFQLSGNHVHGYSGIQPHPNFDKLQRWLHRCKPIGVSLNYGSD